MMDGAARTGMGLTRVLSPNNRGKYIDRVIKEEIKKGILVENQRRFTQAKETPLMVRKLFDELGLLGRGVAADKILKGTHVVPEGSDIFLQIVINRLNAKMIYYLTNNQYQ